MLTKTFLAIDIGATSGRSVIGKIYNGKVEMHELTRFPNSIFELQGKYYWNLYSIFDSIKNALQECYKQKIAPHSIGIDTWGVDFVYLGKNGDILGVPRAYRDPYTNDIPEELYKTISKEELYDMTGIQIMNFNSLFQLYSAKKENFDPAINAKEILFIPDALNYMLTGVRSCEYTIASTSQLLDPITKKFIPSLLDKVGLNYENICTPILPGTTIGPINDNISKDTGVGKIPVIAVAGHDTASAVVAVPAKNRNFAYLSSGTWSLMGIECDKPIINSQSYKMNFTNEGGVNGTIRFLKNICGMWIIEQCRKEWSKEGKDYSYYDIMEMCEKSTPFKYLINIDDPCFANPPSMIQAIQEQCEKSNQGIPQSDGEIVRLTFESMALRYKMVLEMLEEASPFPIEVLHIIGGGAKNSILNQFTANAINKNVIAGPYEATAIGNIMIQAMSAGIVTSISDLRNMVANSYEPTIYTPNNIKTWEEAYKKYKTIL